MGHFDDELSFLILLAVLKGVFVFPTQGGFTTLAINVGNCVQSCQQNSLFSWTAADVHYFIEQVRSPLTTLERLRNEFVVVRQMSPTVNAAIGSMAVWEIRLKRFNHSGEGNEREFSLHEIISKMKDSTPNLALSVNFNPRKPEHVSARNINSGWSYKLSLIQRTIFTFSLREIGRAHV